MLKNKPLKLLELQHVSVFHKTILREPLVPVKVYLLSVVIFQIMLAGVPIILVVYFLTFNVLTLIFCDSQVHVFGEIEVN